MPPEEQKRFVKYTFKEQRENKAKQVKQPRDNRETRRPKQNYEEKDNRQSRPRRHVSYTQKPTSKLNVLKDMINSFAPSKKPSKEVEQLLKNFPRYFNELSKQPEPYYPDTLNTYLIIIGKKPAQRTYAPIQHQSQQEPDWESGSDIEGGIQSKHIAQQFIQKVQQKLGTVKQLRKDQLKRHQKQFLQDYVRQKHQEQLEKQQDINENLQKEINAMAKNNNNHQNKNQDSLLGETSLNGLQNNWTDYQEKQVEDFVNMGFIQKIQGNQQFADQVDFTEEDFSVQDQKSQKQCSPQSSQGDDDIFGDQGPTTIVKKKQLSTQNSKSSEKGSSPVCQGTVFISNHIFSRIAQEVGIPPGACNWILRNKNQRYKVTTQFMDGYYRQNNICESLPQISLNHSQFVHNNDVQKQKGFQILKKFNARKNQSNYHGYHNKSNRNYDTNKKKIQFKPGPVPVSNQKAHLNKK